MAVHADDLAPLELNPELLHARAASDQPRDVIALVAAVVVEFEHQHLGLPAVDARIGLEVPSYVPACLILPPSLR